MCRHRERIFLLIFLFSLKIRACSTSGDCVGACVDFHTRINALNSRRFSILASSKDNVGNFSPGGKPTPLISCIIPPILDVCAVIFSSQKTGVRSKGKTTARYDTSPASSHFLLKIYSSNKPKKIVRIKNNILIDLRGFLHPSSAINYLEACWHGLAKNRVLNMADDRVPILSR